MASYTHFSFSLNQLKEQIDTLAMEALDETYQEMKGWDSYLKAMNKTATYDYGSEKGYIVEIEDLRAWIYYYGTGTHMWDNENPYLSQYMKSDFYNKARPKSGAIVGRGHGVEYTTYNWETGQGTTTRIGVVPTNKEVSQGVAPQGNFNDIIKQATETFNRKLKQKMSRLNLESCFISSQIVI